MLTCVLIQFKASSREIEQQVKQHEAQTLNKLIKVKTRLKKSIKNNCTAYCFFPVNTEQLIKHQP